MVQQARLRSCQDTRESRAGQRAMKYADSRPYADPEKDFGAETYFVSSRCEKRLAEWVLGSADMPAAGVSSNSLPPVFPRCPTCNEKMVFLSVSPTCQSVIYGFICRNDGDRLSWECLQSHQPKVAGSELRQPG